MVICHTKKGKVLSTKSKVRQKEKKAREGYLGKVAWKKV